MKASASVVPLETYTEVAIMETGGRTMLSHTGAIYFLFLIISRNIVSLTILYYNVQLVESGRNGHLSTLLPFTM